MKSSPLSHLIFDLDGTLTDPREGITLSLAHALEMMGLAAQAPQFLEKYIGPPVHEVFRELLKTDDHSVIQEGIRHYRERYSELGLYENFTYPGISEALDELREKGYRLLVCTSKPWVFAEKILEHFKLIHYFDAIYGCELDGTRSNKIELLGYLLQKEMIPAARTVMIGDRKHDALAAQANGTRSLGVLYGFGDEQELRAAGVLELCEKPSDLVAGVRRLAGL